MIPSPELAALGPVVDVFESLGVEYYIGGSVASSHHGAARSTADVDLIADLKPAHVDILVQSLGEAYYIDRAMILGAIAEQSSFNLILLDAMYKVDVFIMKGTPFEHSVRQRVVTASISDETDRLFKISSAEDLILQKMMWYRLGEEVSERQWLDVIGVMEIQGGKLDRGYLSRWAPELGVDDLLARAVREVEGAD